MIRTKIATVKKIILGSLFAMALPVMAEPRLVLFVGVDMSGSFTRSGTYDQALDFLATYLVTHLKGYGELEVPSHLFVGSIGGARSAEAKTMFPIEAFQGKSVPEVRKTLGDIFPRHKSDPYTDYNAFFEQVDTTTKNRKLIMRPISIVLISDGKPDFPEKGKEKFKKIVLKPLETLSRNTTIRLLYTDAETGDNWQSIVPRKRVKIWTQDAAVMKMWDDKNIMQPGKPLEKQDKFFDWLKNNVDFPARVRRVN